MDEMRKVKEIHLWIFCGDFILWNKILFYCVKWYDMILPRITSFLSFKKLLFGHDHDVLHIYACVYVNDYCC